MRSLLLCCLAATATNVALSAPNIIFILADDMGRSDLSGIYPNSNENSHKIQAPRLEELAKSGMVFNNGYSGPVCAPSRTMFVTGRYNGNTTIRGNDGAFTPFRAADATANIPATLRKASYETALIGKWGLGDFGSTGYPLNQSWSTFFGYDSQVACHNWYPDLLYRQNGPTTLAANDKVCTEFSEDTFVNASLQFLESRSNATQPFFLFLSYVTPHAGDCSHEKDSHVQPGPYAVPNVEPPYESLSWDTKYKDYASAITRQDRDTGKVLDKLAEVGLESNTIVIFASDNGPEEQVYDFFNSTGGLKGYKRSLYEGGVRAPMIVRWPGSVKPGSTSDAIVSFTDMLPTFAEAAGLPTSALPSGTAGTSFLDVLKGQSPGTDRPPVYWEFCQRQGRFSYGNGWGQAVRQGDLKLIRVNYNYTAAEQKDVVLELYDLVQDPFETTNLANEKQYAQDIAKLQAIMDQNHVEDVYWPSGPNCCDHQYGPNGPCTPENPPYPPVDPVRSVEVPAGWLE